MVRKQAINALKSRGFAVEVIAAAARLETGVGQHGIGLLSRDWQSVRLSHRGRPPIMNSCCELVRATISAKVLNAEFPPGVDRDGVGRDYLASMRRTMV